MKDTGLPLVTVGIASYNNVNYVVETLNSIVGQTYSNIELIIVDDCSKDNSVEVIEEWIRRTGTECKFIKNETNQGFPSVCNIFLTNAKGKYVSWMGSDDIMMPEKIERQVAVMENEPNDTALVYSDVYLINEHGELFNQTFLEKGGFDLKSMPEGMVFDKLIVKDFIPAMSPLTRKEYLLEVGGYDETLVYEDWDTWLRLSLKYRIKYSEYISAKYRQHSASMWQTRGATFYQSTLNSHKKFLGISPESDKVIRERLVHLSEYVYKSGGNESLYWLKERLKIAKDVSSLVLFLGCKVGLKYERLMAMLKPFRKN